MMKNVFRAISLVLMAAILLANPVVGSFQARAAFERNYSDTIEVVSDVEVFRRWEEVGIPGWTPNTFESMDPSAFAKAYLTHESYRGHAAMLVSYTEAQVARPLNYELSKANLAAGDKVKIEYYFKPLVKRAGQEIYDYVETFAIYPDYANYFHPEVFDIETNENLSEGKDPAEVALTESKWYRGEMTVTLNAEQAGAGGYGLLFHTPSDTMLIDEITMSKEVDGEWQLLDDGVGINNGNFERGVTDAYAAIPEHVTATGSGEAVFLQWKQRDGQRVAVYKQGEDVPVVTTEPGVNTVTISDLEPNVPVTFVLKGTDGSAETAGVEVTATPREKLPDTKQIVAGVEVFSENGAVPHWIPNTLQNPAAVPGQFYLTHEAYEGNAAMLVSYKAGEEARPLNYKLNKYEEYIQAGDTYKYVYYFKPLIKGADGNYNYVQSFQMYANYAGIFHPEVFDIETGENLTEGLDLDTEKAVLTESKWYRGEITMVMDEESVKYWYGLLFHTVEDTMLIDDIKMYRLVDDEYVLLPKDVGERNGDFEEGVISVVAEDPEDVTVTNAAESVILDWKQKDGQQVAVYKQGEDVPVVTTEPGVNTVTISDLEPNVPVTFVLKGKNDLMESEGVTVTAMPYARREDTKQIVAGVEVFSENEAVPHWIANTLQNPAAAHGQFYLTHDAYEGNAAMLVSYTTAQEARPLNQELNKAPEYIQAGDTYKYVYYFKPLVKGADGNYNYVQSFQLHGNYADIFHPEVYDIETGEKLTEGKDLTTEKAVLTESKWYRGELTLVMDAESINYWYGLVFHTPEDTMLIDDIKMYRLVDDEYVLLPEGVGERNGNFEEGVPEDTADETAPDDVTDLQAAERDGAVILKWAYSASADVAGYQIYQNDSLIATLDRQYHQYQVEGLTNDTSYTFSVKAFDRSGNLAAGTTVVATPKVQDLIIGEFVSADFVQQGANTVSVSVENVGIDQGASAQLVVALYNGDDTLIDASASSLSTIEKGDSATLEASVSIADIQADTYTIKMFLWESLDSVKPLVRSVAISEPGV